MRFPKLAGILLMCVAVAIAEKNVTSSRDKRLSQHPRRSGRPPPYAVQMEPIAHYSQRDPLYNPLTADSKSDDQPNYYEENPYNYYPTEPEPIIEIIIKESNESLPTPVPPTPPPVSKTKKEPIQVFYVKYEKKQEYGEDKPRVVYDTPIPAITPVEEHEEIKPETNEPDGYPVESEPAPVHQTSPEPSTTLRTIIRPDSEVYHSGSSGIRVTFGTEQVPPNNHHKRSDKDAPGERLSSGRSTAFPTPGLSKRQHGPFSPIQPLAPRVTPAFPQQRIVNSFAQQQLLGPPPIQQSSPPNFSLQPQFHHQVPPHVRNQFQPTQPNQRPQQRLPITIQGLPEVQQRLPFNSFAPPHRLNVNHPQPVGGPPSLTVSHQNVQLQNFPQHQQQQLPPNQPPANFNYDPQLHYKQQREQEKQRYYEQQRLLERRQQEQKRLQEQQRFQDIQRQQEHQKQQEQFRILEQQRRKQEQEQQKYRAKQQHQQQQQQQQFQQQQQYQQQPFKFSQPEPTQQPQQSQQPQQLPQLQLQLPQKQLGGEILKAIPKLEQHYAIRENPLHPGPFPPNPQYTEVPQNSYTSLTINNQYLNTIQHSNQNSQQQQNQKLNGNALKPQQPQIYHPQQQQPTFQNQQQFFLQNLPPPQQQRPSESIVPNQQASIWARPVFQSKNSNLNDKIYATPLTKTVDDFKKYTATTPNSIRYSPTSPRPSTVTIAPTQAPTTPLTTTSTTLSPKNEAKIKENIASLPDEVPDDIREQLLSSGILGNADIQILDYDKVGGINIGDLPPEALANFYGAGGAAATAASEPVPQIAKASKRPKVVDDEEVQIAASSSSGFGKNSILRIEDSREVRTEEVTLRPGGVEMKVVRFDPNTAQGQTIADRHISENATRLSPVSVGEREPDNAVDGQYNRYLPLKVSGASFPIPSVPELDGKKISSVVVLAPVDYNFQPQESGDQQLQGHRQNRKIAGDVQAIRFLAGESLKQLVKKPTAENYKRWLDQERQTEPQRQSVVLLVTTPNDNSEAEKEIFMYDVSSESVSKLAGDLSTAFVDAAESNSDVNEDPMSESH